MPTRHQLFFRQIYSCYIPWFIIFQKIIGSFTLPASNIKNFSFFGRNKREQPFYQIFASRFLIWRVFIPITIIKKVAAAKVLPQLFMVHAIVIISANPIRHPFIHSVFTFPDSRWAGGIRYWDPENIPPGPHCPRPCPLSAGLPAAIRSSGLFSPPLFQRVPLKKFPHQIIGGDVLG